MAGCECLREACGPPCLALGEAQNAGPPPLLGQELCTGDPFHYGEGRRNKAGLYRSDGVTALAMTVLE